MLLTPFEKPLYKGEILVAKATEPIWTTIFINAAAVVLEVGGPLHHCAIIAREYGIPCVSCIDGAMTIMRWVHKYAPEIEQRNKKALKTNKRLMAS